MSIHYLYYFYQKFNFKNIYEILFIDSINLYHYFFLVIFKYFFNYFKIINQIIHYY